MTHLDKRREADPEILLRDHVNETSFSLERELLNEDSCHKIDEDGEEEAKK